jgi:uncharacterized transporter YbjL
LKADEALAGIPALSYASVYQLTTLLRITVAQVLVILLAK